MLYLHVCIYIYTYIYIYIYLSIIIYLHIYIIYHIYIHVYIYIYRSMMPPEHWFLAYSFFFTCKHTYLSMCYIIYIHTCCLHVWQDMYCVHGCFLANICIDIHVYVFNCTYSVYIYTYICIYTYIYMNIWIYSYVHTFYPCCIPTVLG